MANGCSGSASSRLATTVTGSARRPSAAHDAKAVGCGEAGAGGGGAAMDGAASVRLNAALTGARLRGFVTFGFFYAARRGFLCWALFGLPCGWRWERAAAGALPDAATATLRAMMSDQRTGSLSYPSSALH